MKIFGFISLMGSTIGALSAVDTLVDKKTHWEKLSSFLLFASIGFFQLEMTIVFLGLDNVYPQIQIYNLPTKLLIGPLLYIYLKTIHMKNWEMKKKYLIPFIPSIAMAIIILPYFWLDFETQILIKNYLDTNNMNHPYVWIVKFARLGIFLQTNWYLIYFFIKTRSVFTFKSFSRQILTFHLLMLSVITFSILMIGLVSEIFYYYNSYIDALRIISIMIALLQVYLHLIIRKYPNSSNKMKEEIRKVKYENSNLRNINVEELSKKFFYLFDNEKIYLNEYLKLKDITQRLNLSQHTISQFLNEVVGLNFYELLNKYRIQEAEKLLIENPERTVLNIANDVGFNSQSTFYAAFTKKWKMSPVEFRKKKASSRSS